MPKAWITPGGPYSTFYHALLKVPHLLIAGASGSGKSVVINGMLHALLTTSAPSDAALILIDPKRVELHQYSRLPHCIGYASEPGEPARLLKCAQDICDQRYTDMRRRGLRTYDGADLYIIIDELADLMLTDKKTVQPLLQRIAQTGRGARIHLIAATQCPLASVIPTAIKCNLDHRLALHTATAQDSRNIINVSGAETLPRHGYGLYMSPDGLDRRPLHYFTDDELQALVDYWTDGARCKVAV